MGRGWEAQTTKGAGRGQGEACARESGNGADIGLYRIPSRYGVCARLVSDWQTEYKISQGRGRGVHMRDESEDPQDEAKRASDAHTLPKQAVGGQFANSPAVFAKLDSRAPSGVSDA